MDVCWAARALGWGVWAVGVVPLQAVETLVVVPSWQYARRVGRQDPWGLVAGAGVGWLCSYLVWRPVHEHAAVAAGVWCTAYLGQLAWVLGHVLGGVLLWATDSTPWVLPPTASCPRWVGRWPRVSEAGYLGLFLGLLAAFSLTVLVHPAPELARPSVHTWCRPAPAWSAAWVYVPLLLLGMWATWFAPPVPLPAYTRVVEQEPWAEPPGRSQAPVHMVME